MTVLSGQSIRFLATNPNLEKPIISPFNERTIHAGMSYGLSIAGYDIRSAQTVTVPPGGFVLISSIEMFSMPNNVIAFVHDKSTWARRGIALQNTVIEPGWRGYLTMEVTNHSVESITIHEGSPIAQIVFHLTDHIVENPYSGKYQDQPDQPVGAIHECLKTNK